MKNHRLRVTAVLCLAAFLAGCANPRAQWAVADRGLRQVENGLVAAHASGAISDKDFLATEPSILAARASLKEADAQLTASGDKPTDSIRFYLNLANQTLGNLAKYKVITTQPTR